MGDLPEIAAFTCRTISDVKLRVHAPMSSVMNTASARRAPLPVGSHKQCMKCGKLISRSAFACRRCGKRQRIRPRMMLLALTGFLLAGMFAVASASALLTPTHPQETAPAWPKMAAAPVNAKAATEVTAVDLWAAYARNAADADRQFRDKAIVVSGMVRSLERDYEGSVVARLSTGDAFETVNARLATRNDPTTVGVIKDRPVSLLCVGRGRLLGAPQLGGCFVR
jgi:predicted nucleic acid-binding Zn ribbon protein